MARRNQCRCRRESQSTELPFERAVILHFVRVISALPWSALLPGRFASKTKSSVLLISWLTGRNELGEQPLQSLHSPAIRTVSQDDPSRLRRLPSVISW